jgi:hypothetical protein
VKLPAKFFWHFHQHRHTSPDNFKGVDPESLFVSTVLHSLDHTLLERNVKDPLWLDYEKTLPDFHLMVEFCCFVQVGFMEDLPGLLFTKHYKDASKPV